MELYQKSKLIKHIIIYFFIWLVVSIAIYIDSQGHKNSMYYILAFGAASGYYLIFYFSLKLAQYRFHKQTTLCEWINRLYISSKEIIVHICIVFFALALATFIDPDKAIVQNHKLDTSLLKKVEDKYDRSDINSITEIDGKYIIKFSDGSVELFEDKK